MIERLRLRGLGVIDEAEIELGPGLVAITGETGAGKTMLLTGLALLAGARADTGAVRNGSARAEVDGEWRLTDAALVARLEAIGIEPELDGQAAGLVLGRTVAAEGRSRATVGGRPVAVGMLEEAAACLIAVHGQAEQQRLRSTAQQREILDRSGGPELAEALTRYEQAHAGWREAEQALAALRADRRAIEREAALLRHGVADIEALDPQPGEDTRLDAEASVLAHAGAILEDLASARERIAGDEGAASSLAAAAKALERASSVDPSLSEAAERASAAAASAADLAVDLARHADRIEADPTRQAWVEQRRSDLAGLRRRYGPTVDDVLAWLDDARRRLAIADDGDGAEERQAAASAAALELTANAAASLTAARTAAAGVLAARVTEELAALAMPDARLRIEVRPSPEGFTAHGADDIDFLLQPHAGSDPRPVGKGASGGELSRVMLAIEVALAGADPVPTFVFDEVDAGIGGRAAVEVGRRLARLGRTAQVLVVTHLPQVAAFADRHIVVEKGRSGAVTRTSVRAVEGEDRVAELVRMLSGLEATEAGASHARELLDAAAAERAAPPVRQAARAGRRR